jgi:predicted ATPase with chaperone activity
VLFLDELPEFPRCALEALREPLENGRITLSRAATQAEFPAQFQLIASDESMPLRISRLYAEILSMHARPSCTLPRQIERAFVGSD